MEKHQNKNLLMTEDEEENFQSSNTCLICEKLIEDEKVRDQFHIAGKFRGAAHWNCSINLSHQSCNINLQLTKKVRVIFHNLRGCNSHLIFYELKKFDVKIHVIANRLQKYMPFNLNKNLKFIDGMQFMNSSLDKLVKNDDFKYLTQKFG